MRKLQHQKELNMIEEGKRQEFNERRKMRQTQASTVFESN